jgi:predicted transcriptional regulator YheO
VFDIKGSVETVAEALKLSPNTVYLHLRNLHGGSRA